MSAETAAAPELSIRLSDAEEARCRRYGRAKFVFAGVEFGVLLTVLSGLTLSGLAAPLLALATPAGAPEWLGALLFLVLVGAVTRLAVLPVQFLGEHWLDRRFDVSRQRAWNWLWEWFCRSSVFGLATVGLLFPVALTLRWWTWLALPWCLAFLLLRSAFINWIYHPFLALFYPVSFLRHETFQLPSVGRKTLPVFQVRVSHKTRRANASIRIRGDRTAIYVTDTLLEAFTDPEERVVVAHEFGHLYDQLHLEERTRAGIAQAQRKMVLGSVQLLAGAVSLFLMHLIAPRLGLSGVHDLAGFPLLAALTIGLSHAFSPWTFAESRRDERDADRYALAATGDVQSYVSAMRKLRTINLEESCSTPLSRFLFDTHPSYSERLHLALEYRHRFERRRKKHHWRGWRHIQRHGRR